MLASELLHYAFIVLVAVVFVPLVHQALAQSLGRHGDEVESVVERLRARYHAAAETFVPAGGAKPQARDDVAPSTPPG